MIRATYTLGKFFDEVYFPAKLARRSKTTAIQYRLTIARLEEYAGRPLQIDEVCDEMIDEFKSWRKCAAPTVNKDLRNIRALVNFACRRKVHGSRLRTEPLDIVFEPESIEEPEAWSIEQFAAIIRACGQESGEVCGIPAGKWWVAQQLAILNTSARISSIMGAKVANYDREARVLKIKAPTQKHRRGQNDRLHDMTVRAIDAILIGYEPRDRLFPWPYDQAALSWPALTYHYRRILARANLPTTEKDLFHKLRRTNATFVMAAAGIEAAREQLGHSNASVTARYIDRTKVNRPTAAELLPWAEIQAGVDPQRLLF